MNSMRIAQGPDEGWGSDCVRTTNSVRALTGRTSGSTICCAAGRDLSLAASAARRCLSGCSRLRLNGTTHKKERRAMRRRNDGSADRGRPKQPRVDRLLPALALEHALLRSSRPMPPPALPRQGTTSRRSTRSRLVERRSGRQLTTGPRSGRRSTRARSCQLQPRRNGAMSTRRRSERWSSPARRRAMGSTHWTGSSKPTRTS
jgi:hypothetical protein